MRVRGLTVLDVVLGSVPQHKMLGLAAGRAAEDGRRRTGMKASRFVTPKARTRGGVSRSREVECSMRKGRGTW